MRTWPGAQSYSKHKLLKTAFENHLMADIKFPDTARFFLTLLVFSKFLSNSFNFIPLWIISKQCFTNFARKFSVKNFHFIYKFHIPTCSINALKSIVLIYHCGLRSNRPYLSYKSKLFECV